MVGENAPPPEGWQATARHCGELCETGVCRICQEYVAVVEPLVELGEN